MTLMRLMPMSTEPQRGASGTQRKARARKGVSQRGQAKPLEVSAGGVVLRGGELIVIVPKRRAADGTRVLGLPKGHIDPGESALQAALREVREEAGVESERIADLGEVRYWYTREKRPVSKVVHFFLLRYLSGDPSDHDDEVEEATWMPFEQAAKELTYEGEREIVSRVARLIAAGEEASSAASGREDR